MHKAQQGLETIFVVLPCFRILFLMIYNFLK